MPEDIRWFFRNINTCKQIVGEDKIYSLLKKFDLTRQVNLLRLERRIPLLYNIHLADKQIYEASPHLDISDQIIKIGTLGHYLRILKDRKVSGLDTKINELFTGKFEKIMYEIQVAAQFAKRGYEVEFCKEIQDKKTPDIIVHLKNFGMEIECKKKDNFTSRDKQNTTFWREITKEANKIMNQNRKNLVLIVETKNDPQINEYKSIIQDLKRSIEIIENEVITIERNSYKITLKQADPFDKVILSPKLNLENMSQIWTSAIQSGDYYQSCGISDSNIMLDEESFHCDGRDIDDKLMEQKNRRFFGFRSMIMPDRIMSILDSINKASKQLSGTKPGVIFIDQNVFERNNLETDLNRLAPLINGVLRNNSKISGVVITQIFHIHSPEIYRYRHNSVVYPNEKAKFQLPNQIFEICNIKK